MKTFIKGLILLLVVSSINPLQAQSNRKSVNSINRAGKSLKASSNLMFASQALNALTVASLFGNDPKPVLTLVLALEAKETLGKRQHKRLTKLRSLLSENGKKLYEEMKAEGN